ncbi:MAG: hypothetical protein U0T56_01515 [Ferruginibacter sp.]
MTFTASPVNGDTAVRLISGSAGRIGTGETSSAYTSSTLVNGDVYLYYNSSNETCATGNPATSNSIAMTVRYNLPVSVSISANPEVADLRRNERDLHGLAGERWQ